ncbi:hypothetical protein Tco_0990904 [Tanacetum coccineum]|uniref:Ubiquitin-like protease family profile domain-containing protein n=1 Tax=Tanacetum coccineum TaxID=301880 RepID=A0ABQ5EY36_9ASTR
MVKMVPYEAFACRCGAGDVVLRESYKHETRGKLYYACPQSKPIYSPGSSSTPIYSPGSSTPPRYSPGASTPPSYSLGTSRNAECPNCKHLLDKIMQRIYFYIDGDSEESTTLYPIVWSGNIPNLDVEGVNDKIHFYDSVDWLVRDEEIDASGNSDDQRTPIPPMPWIHVNSCKLNPQVSDATAKITSSDDHRIKRKRRQYRPKVKNIRHATPIPPATTLCLELHRYSKAPAPRSLCALHNLPQTWKGVHFGFSEGINVSYRRQLQAMLVTCDSVLGGSLKWELPTVNRQPSNYHHYHQQDHHRNQNLNGNAMTNRFLFAAAQSRRDEKRKAEYGKKLNELKHAITLHRPKSVLDGYNRWLSRGKDCVEPYNLRVDKEVFRQAEDSYFAINPTDIIELSLYQLKGRSQQNKVGFLHPEMITPDVYGADKGVTLDYLARALEGYEFYVTPYLQGLAGLVDSVLGGSLKWELPTVNRQPSTWECGYYVMRWMHDFVLKYQNDDFPNTIPWGEERWLEDKELDDVIGAWLVTDIQVVSNGFLSYGADGTVKLVQLRDLL